MLKKSKRKIEESKNLNKELLNILAVTRTTQEVKPTTYASLKLLYFGDSNSHTIAPT